MKRNGVEVDGISPSTRLKELWCNLTVLAPRRDFCHVDVVNWALQQGVITEKEAGELTKALVIWQHEEDWA